MSKKVKIAINGFGRIGRAALRIALTHPDVEAAAINDPGDTATLAHLIKYDTVYGPLAQEVKVDGDILTIGGNKISVSHDREPAKLPWAKLGVEVVLECTGAFKTYDEVAAHLKAGAKKVIIATEHTASDGKPKIVKKCSLPLTAKGVVDLIITELAVIKVTKRGLVLKEIVPGKTVEEIQALTGAKLQVARNLKEIEI